VTPLHARLAVAQAHDRARVSAVVALPGARPCGAPADSRCTARRLAGPRKRLSQGTLLPPGLETGVPPSSPPRLPAAWELPGSPPMQVALAASLPLPTFACRTMGLRHLRTRPYRPRTNGKAERFIRTLLAGWAYGAIYGSSQERAAALDGWLWTYNHRRPHGALAHKPPIARLTERNNLAGTYT
jgi:hypothetical protein